MRFGQDVRVAILSQRSLALWFLGFPHAALVDAKRAVHEAREIGQAATLMYALFWTNFAQLFCGRYEAASALSEELIALAKEKKSDFWMPCGTLNQGCVSSHTDKPANTIQMLTSGLAASQSTSSTFSQPLYLTRLAGAYAELGQFDNASRCIGDAIAAVEATNETMYEAEVHRIAGEIALMSPEPDAAKAEACFERALAIARAQKARSWELRAATSMARLWRDQGKHDQARDLLAPIYGWFTEGFGTADVKDAKALLEELA